MKCPNCGEKIDELMEVCPKCKINFEDYEENEENQDEDEPRKTFLLKTINAIQIIGFFISAFISFANEETMMGFILLTCGIITFAFIKGFADIIDLLTSINNKL